MSAIDQPMTVAGRTLALQQWHQSRSTKVLALHGWLDNSASFDFLAPLLPNSQIVAPDLAGHGLSDHRSADAAYNIWQDVAEIHELGNQLGWDEFVLMGHSRGAIIASLFAATFPEKITRLILLDGLVPTPVNPEDAPRQLAQAITDSHLYRRKVPRFYDSREQALASRCRGELALSRKAAEAIASRGLAKNGEGYYWRADQRLRGASEFKLTEDHCRAFVRAIACPTLLLIAGQEVNPYYQRLVALNEGITTCCFDTSHHLHMEEACPVVAEKIRVFLRQ
ncbi:MAG: alpha/beta hydrolase [Porticoccaceae bacterium]|nr:alpha/beta hydrolase [Porticoccaceae bacterium]